MSEDDDKRLNLVLPMQTVKRIERLKEMTLAASTTEVIRSAILNYEAVVEHLTDGYRFYMCKPGEETFHRVHFMIDVEPKSKTPGSSSTS